MSSDSTIGWLLALAMLAAPAAAQTPPQQPPPAAKRPPPSVTPARPAPAPGSVAQSPLETGPTSTTATYGDWVVRCSQSGETQICEVAQTIFVQGQQAPIAVVAIGREKKTSPLRMVLQLPLNVNVATRAKIALKEGDAAIELNFENCVPTGCFAVAQPPDDTIRRLRTYTDPGRISYRDASQRDVAFQFSLRGLSLALDALLKT
jgi:invasion protein IalB